MCVGVGCGDTPCRDTCGQKHLCCFGLRKLLGAGLCENGVRWCPPPRPVLAETSIHRGVGTDGVLPCVVSASHSSVAPSLTVVSSNVSTNSNL